MEANDKTIEEIRAEALLGGLFIDVAVCRGHHADLDLANLMPSQMANLSVLHEAEQLSLQGRRHFRNFIEKDGAALGGFEKSPVGMVRPGEGPLVVPEKLRFEKVVGDRSAMDHHKGLVPAGAQLMERAGGQLLAGAAFPFDEHTGPGVRDPDQLLVKFHHRRGRSDEPGFLFRRRLPLAAVTLQIAHAQDLLDHVADRLGGKGLADIIPGAQLEGLHGAFQGAESRHQDYGQGRPLLMNPPQQLQSVHVRHPDIGNHQVVTGQIFLQGLPGGDAGFHVIAGSVQGLLKEFAGYGIVINDDDLEGHRFSQPLRTRCKPARQRWRNLLMPCRNGRRY